uniref:SIS domain-containing protein n=1 Tax=Candidatus Kentrum sp. DK TaxID=2126562 RepID=A0A450RTJ6_9GAMM|nr:MAG: hypothetical protein BECKDK2373C_GA0170839_100142 [Candidatus Kentron sp. DK]
MEEWTLTTFRDALGRHNALFALLILLEESCRLLADEMATCLRAGGKVLFMGNGSSAADCQHLVQLRLNPMCL